MRTTIDLPEEILAAAKQTGLERGLTLSRVVGEALVLHLQSAKEKDPQFELLEHGELGGKCPSPTQIYQLLDEQERGG
ncbi:MAG: hypothetical protein A2341_16650 [Deltaproteobacteria bacterium RIFOXYB12_FULL_58_9]|nr:MAG: hypothetical protein A2341_16650 [Deltaproteobacteria bacterium RIFOXYB12_FULL_58_9]